MKYCKIFLLLIAIIGLQSCKSVKNNNMATLDGKWTLTTFEGSDVSEAFKGKTPTIEFNTAAGQVFGNGGCNSYSGRYTLNGNQFTVMNAASTMMACIFENKENEFHKILAETSTLILEGNKLILRQNGKDRLIFSKQPPLSAALLAGEWTLMSLEGASANVHFEGRYPTINFDASENRVYGNAGCNSYNGTFTLVGNTLETGRMVTTRMACQNMDGENKFIQLLSGASEIELDENQLILRSYGAEKLRFIKE